MARTPALTAVVTTASSSSPGQGAVSADSLRRIEWIDDHAGGPASVLDRSFSLLQERI